MTVATETNRSDATGNGATDTYPYGFRILDDDDLLVQVEDTDGAIATLAKTTDYNVTGVGLYNGGNVVLVDNDQAWLDADGDLKSGYRISIRRVMQIKQETDLRNRGDFYPETHETVFDRLVMYDQQQQDELDRALKLPQTDGTALTTELPSASSRASKYLAFDASGNVIASGGGPGNVPISSFMETLLDDTTAAAGRATLGAAGKTANELITGAWTFQGKPNYAAAVGSGPAYTATLTATLTALSDGQEFTIKFPSAVTSTVPTLNIDSTGAKTIKRPDGSALTAGDIPANWRAKLLYDGTDFLLLNPRWLGWSTAEAKSGWFITASNGWVLANDGSIGSATSGATTRANADTEALYTWLWNNVPDSWAPVSSGRGASAAADFAANKTLTLPRTLGRALACAGAGSGLTSRALGEYLGAETETPTQDKTASHSHTVRASTTDTTGAGITQGSSAFTGGLHETSSSVGGGNALAIMPPETFMNFMVKL